MTIGERIKQRRNELNMSQDELAKKVGYKSRSSIQKIESARSLPITKVEKMAVALECKPSYLMGWESTKIEIDVEPTPDVKRAMELYKQYAKVSPEIQAAIETLLKSAQQNK